MRDKVINFFNLFGKRLPTATKEEKAYLFNKDDKDRRNYSNFNMANSNIKKENKLTDRDEKDEKKSLGETNTQHYKEELILCET